MDSFAACKIAHYETPTRYFACLAPQACLYLAFSFLAKMSSE